MNTPGSSRWTDRPSAGTLGTASAQLAIFFIILGAKLSLIHQYSMPHPFWDSWHVEGEWLYKPFLAGTLKFSDLVLPASEHRIPIPRLYFLSLLALNGQWDVHLQMVANAILFALFGCTIFRFLAGHFGALGRMWLAVAVTALLAVPSGWENTLNGHHAGWFLFYIFSVVGLWLALTRPPLSPRWLVGLGCITASYFCLFAGVITAATAAGALVFQMRCERNARKRSWLAVGLLVLVVAYEMAIRPRFATEADLRASSLAAFLKAFGYALTWPHFEIKAYGLFLHLPALLLLLLLVTHKLHYSRHAGFVVALAAWAWLQAAGMAYARGLDGVPPVVRYEDILTIGLLAAFASMLVLSTATPMSVVRRATVLALFAFWVASTIYGVERRTDFYRAVYLPAKRTASVTQDFNLRSFVATGDRGYLDNKPASDIAYYGGANQLSRYLTDPAIRRILPASIRKPLSVRWPADGSNGAFAVHAYPTALAGRADQEALGSYTTSERATGRIESDWIPRPRFPFLQFRVAGNLDTPGISLKLLTESRETVDVRPVRTSPVDWTTTDVRAPRTPFRIVAEDTSTSAWFAFSAPREMGWLSYYADRLLARAGTLSWIGYLCGAFSFAVQAFVLVVTGTGRLPGSVSLAGSISLDRTRTGKPSGFMGQ
jgi:hypothetical protein